MTDALIISIPPPTLWPKLMILFPHINKLCRHIIVINKDVVSRALYILSGYQLLLLASLVASEAKQKKQTLDTTHVLADLLHLGCWEGCWVNFDY